MKMKNKKHYKTKNKEHYIDIINEAYIKKYHSCTELKEWERWMDYKERLKTHFVNFLISQNIKIDKIETINGSIDFVFSRICRNGYKTTSQLKINYLNNNFKCSFEDDYLFRKSAWAAGGFIGYNTNMRIVYFDLRNAEQIIERILNSGLLPFKEHTHADFHSCVFLLEPVSTLKYI